CCVCGWIQKNKRRPDFERHVKIHTRAEAEAANEGWQCKGVLISQASGYGLDNSAPTYNVMHEVRVGGCMKTYSRRDALIRHMNNANIECVNYLA
ncbi:hypothetical protein B0H11DRAFT_1652221, partial [Mycena galericulata]